MSIDALHQLWQRELLGAAQKLKRDDARMARGLYGDDPCCDEDLGGSHYHCGFCGKTSGMYGHSVTVDGETQFTCDPDYSE